MRDRVLANKQRNGKALARLCIYTFPSVLCTLLAYITQRSFQHFFLVTCSAFKAKSAIIYACSFRIDALY